MSKLRELAKFGQSVWLDFIRRSYLVEGELKKLVDQGLAGVTSNPTIFEKAIAGSSDYDRAMKALVEADKTVEEIYETLAIEDIRMAADTLMPVYEASEGRDGFVSLEVNPRLAYDTPKTIAEARRLFIAVSRPNVMIKVPATPAGIAALAELIGQGININVTLIFSLESYRNVTDAYLSGLERLAIAGPAVPGAHPVNRVASVASFFVSRVDTAVDNKLKERGITRLQGKIAIANAKLAYQMFGEIFSGPRWERLARQGAQVQRPLWASTSTKNPRYPDTLYVDNLIGPHTVNTMPPETLTAFLDHGAVAQTLTSGVKRAKSQLTQLRDLGIDFDEITQKLQDDGVVAFARSFESLLRSIAEKRSRFRGEVQRFVCDLGAHQPAVTRARKDLQEKQVLRRIWQKDHTVWKEDPTEIADRLDWLNAPEFMTVAVEEIESFVTGLRAEGFTRALLLGMGGSSLAPEVFRKTFGVKEGFLDLGVLDSTDPGAVLAAQEGIDPRRTVFVVSTKSGGTVETLSLMKHFYNKCIEVLGADKAGQQFIAITDPGSGLEKLAQKLEFRKIFLNNPNIGGRYSALTYFGLVPAALVGVNLNQLLERAALMAEVSQNEKNIEENAAVNLGAVLGVLAGAGRDKLTLLTSPAIASLGGWIEQLIAESTGKEGKGILPVDGEPLLAPEFYAHDRLFVDLSLDGDHSRDAHLKALAAAGHPVVRINLEDIYDLGGEFFRWEIATAIAGAIMGINPFDQPDVEAAKKSARKFVTAYQESGELPSQTPVFTSGDIRVYADFAVDSLSAALQGLLGQAEPGGNGRPRSYVALQAYVKPEEKTDAALQALRRKILEKYKLAVTVGYGPRFLHSTGQLHKGDAGHGLFLQFTSRPVEDIPIPDQPGVDFSSLSFGVLIQAQALGDQQALKEAGRKVIRFDLGSNVPAGLQRLIEVLG